jgi:hypothetical protein
MHNLTSNVSLIAWIKFWLRLVRERGLGGALRGARIAFESKLERRGEHTVFRLMRWWYALGFASGLLLIALAPLPTAEIGELALDRLAVFTAICGAGTALSLRSLAMLLASFSTNLLIHRFTVPLRPALLRAGVVALIGLAGSQLAWPASGGLALCLAAVAWAVWPILERARVAVHAPLHITHRLMPLDRLMAMSSRKLPPQARRLVAVHEAGHALFFGLGDRVPEDLFAWMNDEIPAVDEVAVGAKVNAGGAVSAFTFLAEKSIALDLRQTELFVLLGMLCGGAAAERMASGSASAGMVMDMAIFEQRARLYLALYPDPQWPYVLQPSGEFDAQCNAVFLGSLSTAC